MVRYLFIRHGMTNSNLRDARMSVKVARGDVAPAEAHAAIDREAAEAGPAEASGDTSLSDYKGGGVAEAQCLASYWYPILQGKAAAGEVHFSVSAMKRCLQTADPLLQKLGASVRDITVEPRLMEVPGMCEEEDRRWLAQTLGPLATGNETDPTLLDAARTAYNAKVWKECGMSKNEIAAAYPWARHFGAGFSDKVGADNIGWHRGGFEKPADTDARIAGNKEWLLQRAKQLPDADIVVIVAHGDTIWRLLSSFLGIDPHAVGHGIANTSVSSLKVSADGAVSVDFINRTPHLVGYDDDRRNEEFYTFMGLKKRKLRPGKKQLDLSRSMSQTSSDHHALLAKL
eukprot:gene3589-8107_t